MPSSGYLSSVDHTDPRMGRRLATVALVLLGVAAVALLIVLIGDGSLSNPILVAVLTAAALAGLGAWARERRSPGATRRWRISAGRDAALPKEPPTPNTKSGGTSTSCAACVSAAQGSAKSQLLLLPSVPRAGLNGRGAARAWMTMVRTTAQRDLPSWC